MENLIEKRSIVEQVSVAQENLDEKEHEQREKVREAAKTTVKASSWKEAAAAAGVTLVEAGEQTENEEIVQKKKKSLKEMRTGPVKRKESSVKLTESEKNVQRSIQY